VHGLSQHSICGLVRALASGSLPSRACAAAAAAACLLAWLAAPPPAAAQTLDLDGVRQGPSIAAENGALDLAAALEQERAELEVAARTLRGEALASAAARMRLRQVAIALLRSGANRPWAESGPVVLGLRVANLLRGADAAIEAAAAGQRLPDGRPLPADDARLAMDALRALGAMPLERLQVAMRRDAGDPARIIEALAQVLAPVATIVRIVEGDEPLDPWPVDPWPSEARSAGASSVEPRAVDPRAARPSPAQETPAASTDAPKSSRESLEALRAATDALRRGVVGRQTTDAPAVEDRRPPAERPVAEELLRDIAAVLDGVAASPHGDRTLLRGVASAVRVAEWVAAVRSLPLPRPIKDGVVSSVEERVSHAAGGLAEAVRAGSSEAGATPPEGDSASGASEGRDRLIDELAALESVIEACDAMLALREAQGSSDLARRAISDAIEALIAAGAQGSASARDAVRAARRISEACDAAQRLEKGAAGDSPREFREIVRALDRNARIALRALPEACRALAADPAQASDPGVLAPFTRVLTLDADRARIVALHGLIARISAVRPKSAQGIEGATRRLARTLLDPMKRTDAQRGFATVEGLAAAAFPFPFEDELLRRTDRAVALAGGEPDRLLEVAAQARAAWAEAVGRGDLGGPDAVWLDEVARFLAALRDLATLGGPVTRGDADRLALWGGWTARRALIAPAAVDLDARAILAARSLVASARTGDRSDFRRDLAALERSLPLVRLVSRLERSIAPVLPAESSSTAAMLAPLVHPPRSDAAFIREWPRLLMLDRALLESEFARRKGVRATQDELAAFMADLARDIEVGAFGAPVTIGAVPGFDGTASEGGSGRKPADAPGQRRR
jgi:hypothetical protein